MPIHDWTVVDDSLFHDFQLSWACKLAEVLNPLLPSSHFAVTETLEARPPSPFAIWSEPEQPIEVPHQQGTVRDGPPHTQFTTADDRRQYARVGVTVRHANHRQPQGAVLWVTRQDKQTPWRFRSLLNTVVGAITHTIPVVLIDLFPPSLLDPTGSLRRSGTNSAARPSTGPVTSPSPRSATRSRTP